MLKQHQFEIELTREDLLEVFDILFRFGPDWVFAAPFGSEFIAATRQALAQPDLSVVRFSATQELAETLAAWVPLRILVAIPNTEADG